MNRPYSDRILRFEGAKNVRDLGGLPAAAGTTRFGVLFRADGLSRLTETDLARMAALKLRSILDLRYPEERERAPDRVPAENPPELIHHGFLPRGTNNLFHALNVRRVEAAEAAEIMRENYRRMPFVHKTEFAGALQHVIAPDRAPQMIHCTSGKDRTGLVIAFLLHAIGVPRDAIIADYELSTGEWQAVDTLGPDARPEAIAAVMAAPADYLLAAITSIENRCGTLDTYLDEVLGFGAESRARLEAMLVG